VSCQCLRRSIVLYHAGVIDFPAPQFAENISILNGLQKARSWLRETLRSVKESVQSEGSEKDEIRPSNREHCNPDGAEIPFDNILDRVTRSDPSVTDYVLEQPAKCPNCRREILEKTLVERPIVNTQHD
jgi:predicted metal-dependent hydrolase